MAASWRAVQISWIKVVYQINLYKSLNFYGFVYKEKVLNLISTDSKNEKNLE